MNELRFKSNGDGTCQFVVSKSFSETVLHVPEKSPDGDKVISVDVDSNNNVKKIFLPATFKFQKDLLFRLHELEKIVVAPENPYFSSFDGALFDKDMTTLIQCSSGMRGSFVVPSTVRTVAEDALCNLCCSLEEIIFQEGLQRTEKYSLSGVKIITLPASLTHIDKETFDGEYMFHIPTIRAPRNSVAHRFAVKHGYKFIPSDCSITWDWMTCLKKFRNSLGYRALRREVWENTREIVEDNGYTLPDGNSVLLTDAKRYSQFYHKQFFVAFERLNTPPEITVTAEDCLDVAHKWVNDELEVCVLNMANRQNPGGGVTTGASGQEEYLFRCSDYYKFLYRYAPYAERYGVTRSHYQYPLDRNFGGIFSSGVTIFRENENTGYRLTKKPWKVNMIAVAAIRSPRLVIEAGEERIAPELVDGAKNKIRTIFRIACDRGQKNLVLGALGCGAFHNPPKHVAELFREILCEHEFFGAFERICFANTFFGAFERIYFADTNFAVFKNILDSFVPTLKADSRDKPFENPIKKIDIGRNFYALLKTNGEVQIIDSKRKSHYFRRFRRSVDIAAGFDHLIGLREDGKVVFKSFSKTNSDFRYLKTWYGGIAVAACEGHSAMLKADGTVLCFDHPNDSHSGYPPTPEYSRMVESWRNIKQVALTYEAPFVLTRDGKFFSMRKDINDLFNGCGKEIVQIAAFGAYYTEHTIAALYADGTAKACECYEHNYKAYDEVESWSNVKKICCGNYRAVVGLTNEGRVLISKHTHFRDTNNNEVAVLEDIADIAENFDHLIALSRRGEIIYLSHCFLSC